MKFNNKNFQVIRKEKKLKLKFLGDSSGRSYDAIRRWENGDRKPSESDVRMLAKIMEVDVDQISDLKNSISLDEGNNGF
ncbi:MAG TPA: helix-turn-helix transcriptional regulator, partial [Victivallales bacterium]|nr:helix-turn-helix transcriptional regulator [Victivallales bacterium]